MRHYHLVLVLLVLAVVAVLLNACATAGAVKVQCLPLKPYTAAEQQTISTALATADPVLAGLVRDYLQMRDADRACLATKASP